MNLPNASLAYVVLRVLVGFNFIMHPVSRFVTGHDKFVEGVTNNFSELMPAALVAPYAWVITIAELVLGLALIAGFYTRTALVLLAALMASLIFGMSLLQQWSTVSMQMIYVALIYLLLLRADDNRLAFDKR